MPETRHIHIGLGEAGAAFYKAAKKARDAMGMDTELKRVYYSDAPEYEWEARCIDTRLPGTLELVVGSDEGPMDALHRLKAGLAELGLQSRLLVTNIVRVVEVLDD